MNTEIVVALHRSAVYRLLAMAFAYPTPLRLGEVARTAAKVAAGADPSVRSALAALAEAARGGDAAALADEHVALFQRQVRCPPYEGAYGPPQLAGKASLLADIAGFYRAFALEPAEGQPEVEDHVGAELEFMSVLAFKEAWAVADNHPEGRQVTRDAQRAFLRDHLGRWGAAFSARVGAIATAGLYPTAARLLRAWLETDCAKLDVSPDPLEGVSEAEAAPFACPMAPEKDEPEAVARDG